jgi:hypothetical protein
MGTDSIVTETLAFRVPEHDRPALEIRVNFGLFAGRNATQAEIDDLARTLHDVVDRFAIVAEERHEFGGDREASLRQVVIEIDAESAGADVEELCRRVIARAETWAADCIHARSDLGELGSEL